jgi:hypothetical protein
MIRLTKLLENALDGGLAQNESPQSIANKHNVPLEHIKSELKMGIKVEMEHTNDPKVAARISLDHLYEDPDYYTKLEKIDPHHS